jgi:hypothetical protein
MACTIYSDFRVTNNVVIFLFRFQSNKQCGKCCVLGSRVVSLTKGLYGMIIIFEMGGKSSQLLKCKVQTNKWFEVIKS